MAGVQLSLRVRNAVLVGKKFEDFTGETKRIGAGRLYGRMESAQKRITKAPAPYNNEPAHHWPAGEKGKRARRWWFAALRDGRVNPPGKFRRSGRYQSSWRIEKIEDGYRLRSVYPKAVYVAGDAYGQRQYHIHRTRWEGMRDAVEESVKELPRELEDNIVMVARRKGLKQ